MNKINRFLLSILLMISLFLPSFFAATNQEVFVTADVTSIDEYYKPNTPINYKYGCELNGSVCPASTQCNMTVEYPNSSIFLNNVNLTNNNYYFNYTFSTPEYGHYNGFIYCYDNGDSSVQHIHFVIGDSNSHLLSIILGFILIVGFFITLGVTTKSPVLKVITIVSAWLESIYGIFVVHAANLGYYVDGLLYANWVILSIVGTIILVAYLILNTISMLNIGEENSTKDVLQSKKWEK